MKRLLLLLSCVGTPLEAQDATLALRRAEQVYRGLSTLTAQFIQTLENPLLGDPETSRGTLYMEPPNRFAMRFTDPEGDRIVADGTWLWAYAPSSVPGQVIRQPIPAQGTATPNLLAQFVERPLDRYYTRYVGRESVAGESVDVVHLTPRHNDSPFTEATIAISRNSGLIRKLRVREPSGQVRTIVFETVRTDVSIPEAELRFVVPKDVRVVTPD